MVIFARIPGLSQKKFNILVITHKKIGVKYYLLIILSKKCYILQGVYVNILY